MGARIICAVSLICLPGLVCAQTGQISGPVTGYTFDTAARGLRPILGMPGASLLGDPLNFGFDVASAAVAPRQDAAFVTAADQTFHLFRIQSGVPAELALNGITATPERIVFSPSGSAAALYANGSIQIVNGLPDAPAIYATMAQALGSSDSVALSDDGAILLLASGNTVERFAGAADWGKVADTAGPALVAFAPTSYDAAVVDRAGAGIVLYRNLTDVPAAQPLAASDDAVSTASAVAFRANGRQLLLASASGQSVTVFDVAAGSRNAIACSCAPSRLAAMGNVFLLNDLDSAPLWLLDASTDNPTVKFVPAAVTAPVRGRPARIGTPPRGLHPVPQAGGAAPAGIARTE
ncbi:MAG TPA: hypothetical protein VGF16_07915 [Bryobacteraceae bacterium]|jgi:hypothetical protein